MFYHENEEVFPLSGLTLPYECPTIWLILRIVAKPADSALVCSIHLVTLTTQRTRISGEQ